MFAQLVGQTGPSLQPSRLSAAAQSFQRRPKARDRSSGDIGLKLGRLLDPEEMNSGHRSVRDRELVNDRYSEPRLDQGAYRRAKAGVG